MEADVAIHALGGEQWAAMTEVAYTATGNVGYFFHDIGAGSQRLGVKVNSPPGVRGQMTSSRSYDDQLKAVQKEEVRSESLERAKPQNAVWTIPASEFNNSPKVISGDPRDRLIDAEVRCRKRRPRADSEGKFSRRKVKPKREVEVRLNGMDNDAFESSVISSEASINEAEKLSNEVFNQEVSRLAKDRRVPEKDQSGQVILQIKDGPMLVYKQSENTICDPDERSFGVHCKKGSFNEEVDFGGVMSNREKSFGYSKKEVDFGGVMSNPIKPRGPPKEEIDFGGVMSNPIKSRGSRKAEIEFGGVMSLSNCIKSRSSPKAEVEFCGDISNHKRNRQVPRYEVDYGGVLSNPKEFYAPKSDEVDLAGVITNSSISRISKREDVDFAGVMQNKTKSYASRNKEIDFGGVMSNCTTSPVFQNEEVDFGGVMSNRTSSHHDSCAQQTHSKTTIGPKSIKKHISTPSSPKLKHRPTAGEPRASALPLPSPSAKRKKGASSSLPNTKSSKSRYEKVASSSQVDVNSPFSDGKVKDSRSEDVLQNSNRFRSQSTSRLPMARSSITKQTSAPKLTSIPKLTSNSVSKGIPRATPKSSLGSIPKHKPNTIDTVTSKRISNKSPGTPKSIPSPPSFEHSEKTPDSPVLPVRRIKPRAISESSSKNDSRLEESIVSKDSQTNATEESLFDNGFEDTSFMVQRKAGVRHDDIVVGPRRSFNSESAADDHIITQSKVQHSHTSDEVSLTLEKCFRDNPENTENKSNKTDDLSNPDMVVGTPELKRESPVGKVDDCQGRWRKKEKQKMRRGTRPGDVSTESGYATDARSDYSGNNDRNDTFGYNQDIGSDSSNQSLNKAIIEVTTSYSFADSKLPSLQNTNLGVREAKSRIPSADKNVSRSKPKSSKANSDKKQQNNPFLTMHISVPMSYDKPVGKESKSSEVPQKNCEDLSVPFPLKENTPKLTGKALPRYTLSKPSIESLSLNNMDAAHSSTGTSTLEDSSNEKKILENCSPFKYGIRRKVEIPDGFVTKIKFDPDKQCTPNNTPNTSPEKIAMKSSVDSNVSEDTSKTSLEPDSPAVKPEYPSKTFTSPDPPTVKPRFHRSAEHLTQAKLSLFTSSDNILHDDPNHLLADSNPLPRKLQRPTATSPSTPQSSPTTPASTPASSPSKGQGQTSPRAASPPRRQSPVKKSSRHDVTASPVIGIIRRESERSEMCRRGSDRAKFLRRNDPSVEDLKKATSLRELCQSMASLLQIDDETAAEMLCAPLSKRTDLVDGLDADAIVDYLTHHGVLDTDKVPKLGPSVDASQRNSSIVRQVEASGKTAVALFINALRQSGQLHLASSLDTEQRIQPVNGHGYLGKTRHKGEVAIHIKVDALRVLAPREPSGDPAINESLLERERRRIDEEDEEEEEAQRKSCWCFCFSRKSKSAKSAKKSREKNSAQKYEEVQSSEKDIRPSEHNAVSRTDPNTKPHRSKSKEKKEKKNSSDNKNASSAKTKDKKKKSKAMSKSSNTEDPPTAPDQPASNFSSVPDVVFSSDPSSKRLGFPEGGSISNPSDSQNPTNGGFDPIVMEYDPHLELVKLHEGQSDSPSRHEGMMVEQWKSSGRFFSPKASRLCERLVEDFHQDLVKYFEQDRGTLVLDIVAEESAIVVFNICMKREQVSRLQSEVVGGELLDKLQETILAKVDLSPWDIRGVRYQVTLDEGHVTTALSELS